MKDFHTLWLSIPLLNTLQQIFLKQSAHSMSGDFGIVWIMSLGSSAWFILAIIAEIACFILWMRVLAKTDLSKAFTLSAISYVFVLASAWLFYAEPISTLQLGGSGLIILGAWCVSTAPEERSASAPSTKSAQ
ncbi:EamA family transporter [Agrobacterium sp. CNPSo 3708]|uniref:EamA family transporter n=1 Tax=Agrobacterium sp. CNPSo 3708 TaxID=3028150 RepID=UPI002363F07A|nr:EamA family transporter [Agrobacterium sp. CNPSo 3708]MDD1499452.1 EamA family transporter [Agrobacterium sp. CNPSo 3708]